MSKILFSTITLFVLSTTVFSNDKKIAYLVSDYSIPFWKIMSSGIQDEGKNLGYKVDIYNSKNLRKNEIQNMSTILNKEYDGLIISPISSSSANFILNLANKQNIPTVISDIGTDGGEYVSYISSNNFDGAYNLGLILAKSMKEKKIDDGSVGIIAIPQKRENGKLRTKGFVKALTENGISTAGIKQQEDFSLEETYKHAKYFLEYYPDLKALWLQGSDKYKGALKAIKEFKKENEVLLICFDAEPEFLEMIPNDELVGSAMQQPYLMGKNAVNQLNNNLKGDEVQKNVSLEILAISKENIEEKLPSIKLNVLGIK